MSERPFTQPLGFTRRERPRLMLPRLAAPHGGEAVDLFKRGFELARRYERGERITPKRVRELFNVSDATAKRDVTAMRVLLFGANFKSHPDYTYGYLQKRGRA